MECRRKIELLGEEFRRFKVQTSIAQKQRDAQVKNSPNVSFSAIAKPNGLTAASASVANGEPAAVPTGSRNGSGAPSAPVADELLRWKTAYENAMAENERLRNRGEEAAQASQWRERFETCERERSDALGRLHALLEPHAAARADAERDVKPHELLGPGAMYKRYLSLKEEFEVLLQCLFFYILFLLY